MHQSDSNTKLVVMYQDGGLHISPTMDDLVRLHSGHLVNDQTENNKCSSASHSDGVHQPFLSCRLFNEGQTGSNRSITAICHQLVAMNPQHHYLTQSRASGNQRESFELYAESGLTSSTDSRYNLELTFPVVFFSVEMHDASHHALLI